MARLPFLRRRTTATAHESAARELAYRVNDGIHVLLLWHPVENSVSISVDDEQTGERYELPIPPERAWWAFNHPYAFAR
jgi:hypothetical protein